MSSIKNFKKSVSRKSKDNKLSKRFLPKSTKLKRSKKNRIGGMSPAAAGVADAGDAASAVVVASAVSAAAVAAPDAASAVNVASAVSAAAVAAPVELTEKQIDFIVELASSNEVDDIDDTYVKTEFFDDGDEELKRNLQKYSTTIMLPEGFKKYFKFETPEKEKRETFKTQFKQQLTSFIGENLKIEHMLTQSGLPDLRQEYHLDTLRLLLSQYDQEKKVLNSMTLEEFVQIMTPEKKKCIEYSKKDSKHDNACYNTGIVNRKGNGLIWKAKEAPKGCYQFTDIDCQGRHTMLG